MRIIKTYNTAIIFALATLMSSCFEDKGNSDYLAAAPVEIDMTQTTVFEAIVREPLVISPELTFRGTARESDYRYEWIISGELYSEERNLVFIEENADLFWGTFRVIDKKDEIQADAEFAIQTRTLYADGWVVLSANDNNESVLGIVISRTVDGETVYEPYRDIYYHEDGLPLGTEPVRLVSHSPEILVVQNGGRGAAEIDGRTMTPVIFVNEEFILGNTPADFTTVDAAYNMYSNFMLSADGKVYMRYTANYSQIDHVSPYNNQPMRMDRDAFITHIIKPRPGFAPNHVLFYDSKNKRLLCFASDVYVSGGGTVQDMPDGGFTYPENYTKLSDFGDMEFVYASGTTRGMHMGYVMVIKDPAGKHYVQLFGIMQNPANDVFTMSVSGERYPIPGSAVVTSKSRFVNFFLQDYMFFTAGEDNDQLWFYNYSDPLTDAKLIKDYSGEEIVALATPNLLSAAQLGIGLKTGDFLVLDIPYGFHTDTEYKELFRFGFGNIVDISHKPSYFQ